MSKRLATKHILQHHKGHKEYWCISILNDEIVGSAKLAVHEDNCCVMSDLYVMEEHRKNGIGHVLQAYREEIVVSLGIKEVFLFVKVGTWMNDWYTRRGFKYHGNKDDDGNEDKTRHWMKKTLLI